MLGEFIGCLILPEIGTGYAAATIQEVLDMNIENSYSEDYTDPYTSSFLHEPVNGWRLPANLDDKMGQEEFLNTIKSNKDRDLKNSLCWSPKNYYACWNEIKYR